MRLTACGLPEDFATGETLFPCSRSRNACLWLTMTCSMIGLVAWSGIRASAVALRGDRAQQAVPSADDWPTIGRGWGWIRVDANGQESLGKWLGVVRIRPRWCCPELGSHSNDSRRSELKESQPGYALEVAQICRQHR